MQMMDQLTNTWTDAKINSLVVGCGGTAVALFALGVRGNGNDDFASSARWKLHAVVVTIIAGFLSMIVANGVPTKTSPMRGQNILPNASRPKKDFLHGGGAIPLPFAPTTAGRDLSSAVLNDVHHLNTRAGRRNTNGVAPARVGMGVMKKQVAFEEPSDFDQAGGARTQQDMKTSMPNAYDFNKYAAEEADNSKGGAMAEGRETLDAMFANTNEITPADVKIDPVDSAGALNRGRQTAEVSVTVPKQNARKQQEPAPMPTGSVNATGASANRGDDISMGVIDQEADAMNLASVFQEASVPADLAEGDVQRMIDAAGKVDRGTS